jgi:hypothetical protein
MPDPNRTCPTCGTRDGIPKTVTAVRRTIQLALVCRTCRHAWTVEWADPSTPTTRYLGPIRAHESKAEQLRVLWRMQGPQSVIVAALYEHPAGHELRIYSERHKDDILQRWVRDVGVLEGKAEQVRGMLLEQGWLPVPHETPITPDLEQIAAL